MLRELLVSIISGIAVTLILGIFRFGGGRQAPEPRRSARSQVYAPQRRGSVFGGFLRFVLSVAGGLALAFAAMPFVFGRRFGSFDHYDRFDRFDGFHGITSHAPVLILTVIGTIIVWVLLSGLTRR
jgi:hypothetical protein